MSEQTIVLRDDVETYYVIKIDDGNYHIGRGLTTADISSAQWFTDRVEEHGDCNNYRDRLTAPPP